MRKAILMFFLLAAPVQAQGLAMLKLPAKVMGEVGEPVEVKAESAGAIVKWVVLDVGLKQLRPELIADQKLGVFYSSRPGMYRVLAYTALKDVPSDPVICVVVIGQPGPGPDPGPTPIPPPDPKPIPVKGFRVLIVKEAQDKLTKEQTNIWNSTKIAAYLNDKCAKDEKGRPSWRKWDKDEPGTTETETMKALWSATKGQLTQLPAVVIVTDQRGEVLPIGSMTEDQLLSLLKQKGGG